MRRGTTAAIVGATSAAVLIAAYFVADVHDIAPGAICSPHSLCCARSYIECFTVAD